MLVCTFFLLLLTSRWFYITLIFIQWTPPAAASVVKAISANSIDTQQSFQGEKKERKRTRRKLVNFENFLQLYLLMSPYCLPHLLPWPYTSRLCLPRCFSGICVFLSLSYWLFGLLYQEYMFTSYFMVYLGLIRTLETQTYPNS